MTDKINTMGFLEKIEILINHYLSKISELCWKLTPSFVKKFFSLLGKIWTGILSLIFFIPKKILHFAKGGYKESAHKLKAYPVKEKISDWQKLMQEHKEKGGSKMAIPFKYFQLWMSSLSVMQTIMLMIFTTASIGSGVMIFTTAKEMVAVHKKETHRDPASVPEEKFVRPEYYKKQLREFPIMAVKVPLYFSDIQSYRSVMVDLSIVTSNRAAKNFLMKNEQLLRDHFIMNLEPTVAQFNLQVEGKEIIREKIREETTLFLKSQHIEDGEAEEVEITYILAH